MPSRLCMCRGRERAAYKKPVKGMSSKARVCAKCLERVPISAARWDRRRGCRAAESPAYFPYLASAREFPDQHRRADIAPHRTSPACHPAARLPLTWWSLQAQSYLAAGPAGSARNCSWEPAARFEPVALPATAGPARSQRPSSPSAHMTNRASVLSASGKTDRAGRGSALNSPRLQDFRYRISEK